MSVQIEQYTGGWYPHLKNRYPINDATDLVLVPDFVTLGAHRQWFCQRPRGWDPSGYFVEVYGVPSTPDMIFIGHEWDGMIDANGQTLYSTFNAKHNVLFVKDTLFPRDHVNTIGDGDIAKIQQYLGKWFSHVAGIYKLTPKTSLVITSSYRYMIIPPDGAPHPRDLSRLYVQPVEIDLQWKESRWSDGVWEERLFTYYHERYDILFVKEGHNVKRRIE